MPAPYEKVMERLADQIIESSATLIDKVAMLETLVLLNDAHHEYVMNHISVLRAAVDTLVTPDTPDSPDTADTADTADRGADTHTA